ncbi:DNA N-6-adenine-methyltransferase [Novosphingobium sp.]|uniref:DNA N-6-adenine-methyltransferase n=1 Tax=Novosphingobium sp. TaxID=1874826 RepID=UPI002625A473|nr:DNA N-6-adenine-methyltransferase [Novosphingobium sp.]
MHSTQILINDLREARRQSGLTQRSIAARIGVSPQVILRLEQGVGSVATLAAMMKALDFRLTGLGPGATIGEQMHNRRLKQGWTLQRLAERTKLSRTTIAAIERGGGSVASLLTLLAVVAPKVRRRAPERSYWGEGDKHDRDSRFTPPEFLAHIYEAFGSIDLDPCGHESSPVIAKQRILLSEGGDGLAEPWSGRLTYVNPPFSKFLVWLKRAHDQWQAGNAETVLCLGPVRTDSIWFQDVLCNDADIYLLRGRLRFTNLTGKAQNTPFSLMVVMLGTTPEQRARFAELVPGRWLLQASIRQVTSADL